MTDKDRRIKELEDTIALLERRMVRLEQGWATQERIADNQRTLLRRVNAEYESTLERLGKSEARFRRLTENSRDIIFRMSYPEGRYEYISPAVETITGYAPDDYYATPMLGVKVAAPDCREYLRAAWGEVAEGRIPDALDFRIIAKDGREVWVHQRNTPVYDKDGVLVALEGMATDVTAQKLAERRLAESEQRYRTLVHESPVPMVVHEGTIVLYANPEALSGIGGKAEEVVGRSIMDFLVPDSLPQAATRLQDLDEGPERDRGMAAYKIRRLDGLLLDVLVKSTPIVYDGRNCVVSSVYDVSELREVARKLRDSEAMARILLNQPLNYNMLLDSDFRILDVNEAMAGALGGSQSGLRGKGVFDLLPPEVAANRRRRAVRSMATGEGDRFEDANQGRFFDNVYSPIPDSEGRPVMLAVTARDISDLKQAQNEIEEARLLLERRVEERTHDLARARSRFYSLAMYQQERIEDERKRISREIHDELGQSLTGVRMGLSRLDRYRQEPDAFKDRVEYLMDIVAQAIASVQRISGELRPMHLDDMGLASAIRSLAREFGDVSGMEVGLHLDFEERDLHRDLGTAVYRVVQEALTNSTRHSGGDRVEVVMVSDGSGIEVIVSDNGKGIKQGVATAPKSFGLIGMRERVGYFGGSFEVRAGPDGGTEVWAYFPGRKN